MEHDARNHLEPVDDGACDSALRVDAQKKTLAAAERNEVARNAYRSRVAQRAAADFVVVDECGSNINLTPRYGRAPRGVHATGTVPRNTERNTTLVVAITTTGMGAAMTLEGALDAAAFEIYVDQFLIPTLAPGQVVVLDDLSAHKGSRIQAMIEAQGCEVWFLPAYSPDVSPIEEAFSKLKTLLRPRLAGPSQKAPSALPPVF